MLDIEPIEYQAMQMLLEGDHPTLETLRQQFNRSCVVERDFTGVGILYHVEIDDSNLRLDPSNRIVLGDVCADVACLKYGCGFILFVDDGLLGTLECHLWGDDALPQSATYTRLYYVHQPNPPSVTETVKRDM